MAKEKPHINLVVIGHVDSGKSTSTGHLVYLCGGVDQRTLEKFQKEAELIGKGSFCFAWILDRLKAERVRGTTINISLTQFETAKHHYTVIDAPGHRDYIKNMMTGTALADCALLMISAVGGEFEEGMSQDGLTKQHALLAYTLGLKEIIVAVNKMDHLNVNYGEERFKEIQDEAKVFLKNAGYKPETIQFVPISGWTGENIKTPSGNMAWYKGPTLLDAFDKLPVPKRPSDKPLRVPLSGAYKIGGVGTVVIGRVATGIIRPGMSIAFAPTNITAEATQIEIHYDCRAEAIPGDVIGFVAKGVNHEHIQRGHVASNVRHDPAGNVTEFLAQIIVLNHPGKLEAGYTPIIDCHTAHIACRFEELKSTINKRTGQVDTENPKFIKAGQAAMVRMVPQKPMSVEPFSHYPPLGRFAIRDLKQVVGVGVIKETTKKAVSVSK